MVEIFTYSSPRPIPASRIMKAAVDPKQGIGAYVTKVPGDDRQAAIYALMALVNSLKSGAVSFDHKLVVIVEKVKS